MKLFRLFTELYSLILYDLWQTNKYKLYHGYIVHKLTEVVS